MMTTQATKQIPFDLQLLFLFSSRQIKFFTIYNFFKDAGKEILLDYCNRINWIALDVTNYRNREEKT